MSPSPLSCTDAKKHEYLSVLFHHLVAEKTNTGNGRAKMHVKLLC